jgi:hypothetical protein
MVAIILVKFLNTTNPDFYFTTCTSKGIHMVYFSQLNSLILSLGCDGLSQKSSSLHLEPHTPKVSFLLFAWAALFIISFFWLFSSWFFRSILTFQSQPHNRP